VKNQLAGINTQQKIKIGFKCVKKSIMQKPKKGSKEEINSAETVPTPPNLHFCPFLLNHRSNSMAFIHFANKKKN